MAVSLSAIASCLALGLLGPAQAQDTTSGSAAPSAVATDVSDVNGVNNDGSSPPSYDRGGNTAVMERQRPDYQAIGIHLGGFTVFPKLTASLSYDDNIFAQRTGAVADGLITTIPEINIQSNWSRNALAGRLWVEQDSYLQHSSEDATPYGGDVAGKLELGQTTISTTVTAAHEYLPRIASVNIGEGFSTSRTPYDTTTLDTQIVREFNRIRFTGTIDYLDTTFQNGTTKSGAVVFNEGLNHETLTYSGKAEFAVTPDAAVFIDAIGNAQHYPIRAPTEDFTRESAGYQVSVGANFDLTHLIRGQMEVGYISQTYVSAAFKPIDGPSVRGQLEWFPTQLTTVTVQGSRSIADALVPGSAGDTTSMAKLEVDHELLRNLILSANATIENDEYNGISRTDDRTGAGVSANWLLKRWLGLTFAYSYSDQRSSGVAKGPIFSDNKVSISTVFQF